MELPGGFRLVSNVAKNVDTTRKAPKNLQDITTNPIGAHTVGDLKSSENAIVMLEKNNQKPLTKEDVNKLVAMLDPKKRAEVTKMLQTLPPDKRMGYFQTFMGNELATRTKVDQSTLNKNTNKDRAGILGDNNIGSANIAPILGGQANPANVPFGVTSTTTPTSTTGTTPATTSATTPTVTDTTSTSTTTPTGSSLGSTTE